MQSEESLKDKTVKGAAWSFAGTIANKGIQFAVSLLLARMLTPSDYGLIGMLGFFIGLAGTFIDCGFSSALIQYKDRSNSDYCTVFYVNLGLSFLMYGVLYGTSPLIAEFYHQPQLVNIIRVYCLTFLIGSLTTINSTQLSIDLNFKLSNIINTVSAIISGLIGVICAYSGMGVWSLVAQQMSATIFRMCLLLYTVRWFPSLIFSIKSFRRLFAYGSKLLVAGLIHTVYANMYPLIIGKKFSSTDLGYVSRAQGFNEMAGGTIMGILGNLAFPVLSRVQDDDETLLRLYSKYIQISAFCIFPVILFLVGIAKPLILFLLTDKWAPSIILFQILSPCYIWDSITRINLNLLYVKGRTDLVLRLEVFKKTLAFIIMIATTIIGNLYIMCLGITVYAMIALYCNTFYTKRLLNYGFLKQMRQIWPYLSTSLTIMAIAFIISAIIPHNFLSLIVSTLVCIPLYLYIAYSRRFYAFVEIVQIVGPKAGRLGKFLQEKLQ